MWSFGIVLDEVLVEHDLHLVEGLKPSAAAFGAVCRARACRLWQAIKFCK
jgi:hypothetical protein